MLAGVLAGAGYYMGESLHAPRSANPLGFFEDREINLVNEELLARVTPKRPLRPFGILYRSRPKQWQRWLATVPIGTPLPTDALVAHRMDRQTRRSPYCFKDPRFCYTLPAWRPYVRDAAFLCIFRSPGITASSILKECKEPYLRDLKMDRDRALKVWTLQYRHVLEVHSATGDWLFVHSQQVLDHSAAPRIERLLGIVGDWSFPRDALQRSQDSLRVPGDTVEVYQELCRRAGYRPPAWVGTRLR